MAAPYRAGDFCEHCRPKWRANLAWICAGGDEPAEPTTTPEDTLRRAGISSKRQAKYQRRMSRLLAGRE